MSQVSRTATTALLLLGSACQVESLFPERVGDGAARLTVRNAGVLLSVINADSLKETRRLTAGRGPWSLTMRSDAAAIYVTSVRPDPARFRDPPQSEVTVLDVGAGLVSHRHTAADANMLQGIAWVPTENVALFTLMRTKNLVPITRAAQEPSRRSRAPRK